MAHFYTTRTILLILTVSFLLLLTGCGGGGSDGDDMIVMPDDETLMQPPDSDSEGVTDEGESILQKPEELPALPLLSGPHAQHAPIIQREDDTHVGGMLGYTSGSQVTEHGEVDVFFNDMQGGLRVADLLTYLASDAEPYGRIKRRVAAPTIYLDAEATSEMVNDTMHAVQIINSFLPPDWQLSISTATELPGDVIEVFFQDVGLSERGVGGTTLLSYDANLEVVGATVYVLPTFWTDATANRRVGQNLLVHELLHALGRQHADPNRDRRLFSSLTIMDASAPSSGAFILFPVDREALYAIHGELAVGDTLTEAAEKLGDWQDKGLLVGGEFDLAEGAMSFGVSQRNGLTNPWANGPTPWTLPAENSVFEEIVTWEGRLLGLTPAAEPVAGSARLDVDLSNLAGDLAFQSLESWAANNPPGGVGTGQQWGDGALSYSIEVLNNTFIQTGGDEGIVTGAFFGPQHDGMGGVLERDDLTAAFGGKR